MFHVEHCLTLPVAKPYPRVGTAKNILHPLAGSAVATAVR
jgi:hypothetical protein